MPFNVGRRAFFKREREPEALNQDAPAAPADLEAEELAERTAAEDEIEVERERAELEQWRSAPPPRTTGWWFKKLDASVQLAEEPFGHEVSLRKEPWLNAYFEGEVEHYPNFGSGPSLFAFADDFEDTAYASIQERFPADEDVRSQMAAARGVFVENYSRYSGYRLTALGFIVAVCFLFAYESTVIGAFMVQFGQGAAVAVACSALIFMALVHVLANMGLGESTRATSARLSSTVQAKLAKIYNAFTETVSNVRDQYTAEGEANSWPMKSAWRAKLMMWYPKRAEHIQKAFQIEMFRLRSSFSIIWLLSSCAALLIGGAGMVSIVLKIMNGNDAAGGIVPCIVLFGVAFGATMWTLISLRPQLNSIRAQMDCHYWSTFSDFKMHQKIADLVKADKRQIIDEQNRQRASQG